MTVGRKIGLALILLAFVGAKLFLLFSGTTGIVISVLGALLAIPSDATAAY